MKSARSYSGLVELLDLPFHFYRLMDGLFGWRLSVPATDESRPGSADALDAERDRTDDRRAVLRDGLRGLHRVASRGA